MKYNRLRGKQDDHRPGAGDRAPGYGSGLSGQRGTTQYYTRRGGTGPDPDGAGQYRARQDRGHYAPKNGSRQYYSRLDGSRPYSPRGEEASRYAGRRSGRRYARVRRSSRRPLPKINGELYKLVHGLCSLLLSAVLLALTVMFILSASKGGGYEVRDISRVKPGYEGYNAARIDSLDQLTGFSYLEKKEYAVTDSVPCVQPNPYMNGDEYTHSELNAGRGLMYGIDVSSRNGGINWFSVRLSGIDFAILRAGSRGYTEGRIYEDSAFDTNARCALNAGVRIGAYFYSQATNEEEILQEAEVILRRVKGYDITMPVILDFEFAEVDTGGEGGRLFDADLSVERATDMCLLFCRRVREEGYTPMVYANTYMLTKRLDAERLAQEAQIWVAYPSAGLKYAGENEMWQYSWSGKVPGVRGDVDMDFGYYDQ